nr:hypothetical protein [Nocardioides jensenii]
MADEHSGQLGLAMRQELGNDPGGCHAVEKDDGGLDQDHDPDSGGHLDGECLTDDPAGQYLEEQCGGRTDDQDRQERGKRRRQPVDDEGAVEEIGADCRDGPVREVEDTGGPVREDEPHTCQAVYTAGDDPNDYEWPHDCRLVSE